MTTAEDARYHLYRVYNTGPTTNQEDMAKVLDYLSTADSRINALEKRNTTLASRVIEMEAEQSSAADLGRAAEAYYAAGDAAQAASVRGPSDDDDFRPLWDEINKTRDVFASQLARYRANVAQGKES